MSGDEITGLWVSLLVWFFTFGIIVLAFGLTIGLMLLFGFLCRNLAPKKGQDPNLWFLIGLFGGWIALVVLVALPAPHPPWPRRWVWTTQGWRWMEVPPERPPLAYPPPWAPTQPPPADSVSPDEHPPGDPRPPAQ